MDLREHKRAIKRFLAIWLGLCSSLTLLCGSVAIESKSKITYLGLTFDNDMSFSYMGNSVIKKGNF